MCQIEKIEEEVGMADLKGKIAIVTGANAGMGLSTVEALSDKGAAVIMLCRNEERGRAALAKLTGQKERDLDLFICDLGDYASIRNFVRRVKENFIRELARRLKKRKITVNCCHPGAVAANIGVDRETGFGKTITGMLKPFFQTPAQGAETAVFLASDPSVKNVTGGYFYRCKPARSSKRSKDRKLAKRLFAFSQALLPKKIKRIRSGGQTGVDRAALDLARKYQIEICGWCPKGGWAEDLPSPPGLLAEYPELKETPSSETAQRTRWNMRDADAILTIMPESSAESKGTLVGLEEGTLLQKPMFTARGPEDIPGITAWLETLPDGLDLCVGGPRASECPEAYQITTEILSAVLRDFLWTSSFDLKGAGKDHELDS